MKSILSFLRYNSRQKTFHFKLFGLVFGMTGLLLMFITPNTVYAGGGVGGGGGAGGGGGGHQSSYGWGWAIYQTSGPGPTDGYRNGGSWASTKSTCQNAGASTVYAFIVNNNANPKTSMIYDYSSSWDNFSNHITSGRRDNNPTRASAIDTNTARNAFNNLGSYGVNTSGYTFGSNVAWFCYDYNPPPPPPPPPPVNVQIHVFKTRTDNTGSYTGVSGATTLGNCGNNASAMTTDGNGYANRDMADGAGLCLRLTNSAPAVAQYQSIAGPYIRPWGEGYGSCGNFQGNGDYSAHCGNTTYECQRVGTRDPNTCGGVDRASDRGFDFVYVITPAPAPSCSISANPNPMNEGENTTISWSSSYGSSMTVTGNGRSWGGTSGSRSDNPTRTVTYTGSVSNADGSASCSTTVVVVPLPDCSISANPNSYVGGGSNSTTITWSSTNAASVNITRSGTNFASGLSGSQSDNQQTPNTYTYTCTATIAGAHGVTLSRSRSVNLTVYPPPGCSASPASPPYYYAPNDTVTYVASGGDPSKTYTWSSGTTGTTYSTPYGSAGFYTVSVTNGGVTRSCSAYVVNKPFHRVFGGDTLAGVGFAAPDSSCPAASIVGNKRQLGFTRNVGGNYTGGGNSHANIATGSITEFVSGMLEPGPSNPRVFAFANTGGGYGGNFNTGNLTTACATNYYSKMAPGLPPPPATVSGLADGSYSYNGNLSLGGGTVPSGVHAIIYVNGNVFISSNIAFAGSGAYGTDPTNIPSLRIVAQGNIYVGSGVSELNGVYVAQPNGASGGSFYTCGFDRGGGTFNGPSISSGDGSSGNPYVSSEYISQCASQPLSIYGAVVAKNIMLYRSQGTLPGGTEGYPSSAAERFIYTPDTWFNGDPSTSKPFQSYTALPPLF